MDNFKKFTIEYFILKAEKLEINTNNQYLTVYHELIDFVKNIREYDHKAFISVAHMVYGWMQIKYGVEKSQKSDHNKKILNEFLGFLNILPFDSESASVAGSIRSTLEKKGQIIGPYDLLIASQALAKDVILVTNNEKEFKRIKNLKVENWITK